MPDPDRNDKYMEDVDRARLRKVRAINRAEHRFERTRLSAEAEFTHAVEVARRERDNV